ncbi:hypothetical protein BC629DRAFT_191868 [Irpex lacteus]|nr:hypothetical protein BC629DRAFT_191868 [Irpex lacteus]
MSSIPTFQEFIGPAFIITCFTFMLYGTFCAQLYYYWANYHDDIVLQSYVAIVGILESIHTGLCIHIFYEYLVNAWGDPFAADKVIITTTVSIYFMVVISAFVQAWYIWRIWRLRKQIVVVAILGATVIVNCALSFRACVYSREYDDWLILYAQKKFTTDVNANFGLNLALDTAITSILIFYLLSDRSKVTKRSTKKMITNLINFVLSTGVLIVLTSCGLLISFNVSHNTITWGGMLQFLAKVYANSMLAALNVRQGVMKAAATSDTKFGVELSQLSSSAESPHPQEKPMSPIQIRAQTATMTSVENWRGNNQHENTKYIESEGLKRVGVFGDTGEEV